MREIQADLQERIRIEEQECKNLEAALIAKKEYILLLKRLLDSERSRFPKRLGETPGNIRPTEPLADFVLKTAENSAFAKDELVEAAKKQGYFIDSAQSQGRIMHGTVLGLLKKQLLKKTSGGKYIAVKENAPTTHVGGRLM
jgi:hypothetical protein